MQIGDVIRKYRKDRNMTQEEMAKRLGVTAPAVNKWENGNSCPDILLLAPIARLLDISLDTLLDFREELTQEEINSFIVEADRKMETQPYSEVFEWSKKKLEAYPNSEALILNWALFFDSRRVIDKVPDSERYNEYILQCFQRLLDSRDENIKSTAAEGLYTFYFRSEQYEKAEEYLSYFSDRNPDKKRRQAEIYRKTHRIEEAYKAYEELLFYYYQMVDAVFYGMQMLARQEKDQEKVLTLIEKEQQLAKVFDRGEYIVSAYDLEMATLKKDSERTIEVMERLLKKVDKAFDFCKSPLYKHMKFKELPEKYISCVKEELLDTIRDKETYAYLKSDKRWQELGTE